MWVVEVYFWSNKGDDRQMHTTGTKVKKFLMIKLLKKQLALRSSLMVVWAFTSFQ